MEKQKNMPHNFFLQMVLNATFFGFCSNGVLWVVGTINLWKSQEPTPIWEKSGQVKPKEEDVESHATQCGWFFWNIFDETANCVMYEVQNFLSATSIFVEKFLLNIFAAAVGILCQKFVNFNRFKLYHLKVIFLRNWNTLKTPQLFYSRKCKLETAFESLLKRARSKRKWSTGELIHAFATAAKILLMKIEQLQKSQNSRANETEKVPVYPSHLRAKEMDDNLKRMMMWHFPCKTVILKGISRLQKMAIWIIPFSDFVKFAPIFALLCGI